MGGAQERGQLHQQTEDCGAGRSEYRTLGDEASGPEGKKVCRRRNGWPLDRFSEVIPGIWSGYAVVCVAPGPSLNAEQCELIRCAQKAGTAKVIAVNSAIKHVPFADVHYFADAQYWKWNKDKPFFSEFEGQRITIEPTGLEVTDPRIHMLRDGGASGLSVDSPAICNGRNGGYQIVNIATLAGGNPIALVGYDMKHIGGKDHAEGCGHPVRTPAENLATYARNFRSMIEPLKQIGVTVLNATPGSAIDCFPRVGLEEVFA